MKYFITYFIFILVIAPSTIFSQSNSISGLEYYNTGTQFKKFLLHKDISISQRTDSIYKYFSLAIPLLKKEHLWDELISASYMVCRYDFKLNKEKALSNYESLADTLKKYDPSARIEKIYLGLAALIRNEEPYRAAKYYDKAAALTKVKGNDKQTAAIFKLTGDLYLSVDSIQKALLFYSESLRIKKKNGLLLHMLYKQISLCHRFNGSFDLALKYIDSAIVSSNENILERARYLNDKGAVYNLLGDYDKALEYCNKAIKMGIATKVKNLISLINNYRNVAVILNVKGDFVRSNEYLDESIALIEKYNMTEHDLYSHYYLKIDNYISLLEFKNAKRYCDLLYSYLKVKGDDLSYAYNVFGKVYYSMNQIDSSLAYFKLAGPSSNNYKYFGDIYFKLGDYSKSRMNLENFLSVINKRTPKDHLLYSSTYNQIGNTYFMETKLDSAMMYYNKVLGLYGINAAASSKEMIEKCSSNDMDVVIFETYWRMSQIYKKDYQNSNSETALKNSNSCYMMAAEILNNYKQFLESESSKLFWSQRTSGFLDEAVDNAFSCTQKFNDKKYLNDLFRLIEMSKMHVLKGSINESSARYMSGIPDSIIVQGKNNRGRLNSINISMRKELESNQPDSTKIKYWEREIFSLKRDYYFLVDSLEKSYPEYFRLKYETGTVEISTVQNSCAAEQTVLEYYLGTDKLYVLIINSDTVYTYSCKADSDFNSDILRLVEMLKKGNLIRSSQRTGFIKASNSLYTYLLGNFEKYLERKKELVIIPGGILLSLPFEVLISSASINNSFSTQHFLLNKYIISYQYSATLGFDSRYRKHSFAQDCFTGFAPAFKNEKKESGSRNLAGLLHNEEEVKEISELFRKKKKQSYIYIGNSATKKNFKALTSSKYLHLATHSIANEESPELSALYFTDDPGHDNTLYSDEVFSLDINAELVVLSSCETGTGKLINGEGTLAMTRGFIYHNIPYILFSLWEVSDKSTSILMIDFYRNILSGKDYKTALRDSKLKLLSNEFTSFPDKWGAFILIGN